MYIEKIEICDVRSFAGRHLISLNRTDFVSSAESFHPYAGWTVFAGRNGTGKSTLLKAIAASVVGPLAARSLAASFPAWVRKGKHMGQVGTLLHLDSGIDLFQQKGQTTQEPFWSGLQWKSNDSGSDSLERWLDNEKPNRRKAAERGPWAEQPQGWFIAGYGPYRHLGAIQADQMKVLQHPVLARLHNLFNESATLTDAVDWLKQVHFRALENKPGAKQLREDVLELLRDGLLPDGSLVDRVDSDGLWITRNGVTVPLDQVSDGYRTVAALVVDLVQRLVTTYGDRALSRNQNGTLSCSYPGVVLIDEVDGHMHVSWQQRIGFWLTEHFPGLQFLVTTHSPFICQAASPGGIIRLPAPNEDRTIEHIDPRLFTAIVNGGADAAVMSELFGLEHAHSQPAEALRQRLAGIELKLIRNNASEQEKNEYQQLRQKLPDTLDDLAEIKVRALTGRGLTP